MARIVVVGAGLGGMSAAYELRETLGKGHEVTLVGKGELFGFDSMQAVWACWLVLPLALYPMVKAFSRFKARRRDLTWLKYL